MSIDKVLRLYIRRTAPVGVLMLVVGVVVVLVGQAMGMTAGTLTSGFGMMLAITGGFQVIGSIYMWLVAGTLGAEQQAVGVTLEVNKRFQGPPERWRQKASNQPE